MKILIDFQPAKGCDNYEGARLRKSLKGACESADVTWVDGLSSHPEIAHYLSPEDDKKAKKAAANGCKIVYSVGYSDSDRKTNFFEEKNDERKLKAKGLKALLRADLILVPDSETKRLLEKEGVTAKIVILEPTVNLARFEFVSQAEKSIFKRYFSIKEGDMYVVAVGESGKKGSLECFESLAEKNPNIRFFVLFNKNRSPISAIDARRKNAKSPKNLIFSPLVEDDVYRSALLGASAFVKYGGSHDAVSIYEAFASKTPLIAIGSELPYPFLKNGKNCLAYRNAEEVPSLEISLSKESIRETIITAYRQARDNALPIFGKKLKACYQELLNQKEDITHD